MTAKARMAAAFWHPVQYRPPTAAQAMKAAFEKATTDPDHRLGPDEIKLLEQALQRNDDDCFNDLRRANKLLLRISAAIADGQLVEQSPVIGPLVSQWLNGQGICSSTSQPEPIMSGQQSS